MPKATTRRLYLNHDCILPLDASITPSPAEATARARPGCGVKVEEDRIFIIDGPVWTSVGMTAGIDLALAMID